ncbi:MAG: Hpt domain [Acidimicrobiaceae bacterium]
MTTADALDHDRVNALRDFGNDSGELLAAMLADFLVEAPQLVTEIEAAMSTQSHDAAARAAHRLRGITGHIGATRLGDIASQVEIAAGTGFPVGSAALVAAARVELGLAVTAACVLLAQP